MRPVTDAERERLDEWFVAAKEIIGELPAGDARTQVALKLDEARLWAFEAIRQDTAA